MGSLQSHQNSGRPCIRSESWSSKRYMNTQLIGGWVKIHTADHLGWESLCFSQFSTISKALEKRHTNLEEEQRTVSFSTAGSSTTPNTAYLKTQLLFFSQFSGLEIQELSWEFRRLVWKNPSPSWLLHRMTSIPFCSWPFFLSRGNIAWQSQDSHTSYLAAGSKRQGQTSQAGYTQHWHSVTLPYSTGQSSQRGHGVNPDQGDGEIGHTSWEGSGEVTCEVGGVLCLLRRT